MASSLPGSPRSKQPRMQEVQNLSETGHAFALHSTSKRGIKAALPMSVASLDVRPAGAACRSLVDLDLNGLPQVYSTSPQCVMLRTTDFMFEPKPGSVTRHCCMAETSHKTRRACGLTRTELHSQPSLMSENRWRVTCGRLQVTAPVARSAVVEQALT